MKKENWYRVSLFGVIIASIISILTISYQKNSEIKELEFQINKMSTELFINSSQVGKYDLAIDSFNIVNPKGGNQLQNILNSGQYE
jgi:hypothetical protein